MENGVVFRQTIQRGQHLIQTNYKTCICDIEKTALKPIFHWKLGLRWAPNANEIYSKNMKCTWPTQKLYSTPVGGFALGNANKFASPNARDTNMLVFFALGNAKVLSFALGDAKVPNANGFASQWNVGFSPPC